MEYHSYRADQATTAIEDIDIIAFKRMNNSFNDSTICLIRKASINQFTVMTCTGPCMKQEKPEISECKPNSVLALVLSAAASWYCNWKLTRAVR